MNLAVETLLLTGSEDQPDFRLIADLIEGAAPGVKRVDLEGSGHLLTLEQPVQVLARVREFLT
jgi:pimeloyl-ACP methyl ester carboxylesterase